jgi:hypothetical protein
MSGQLQVLWASTEELLVSYNDTPFVSETYRNSLDGVGGRAERLAAGELPPELPEWLESLGQSSVRVLSVKLLIDLFTLEQDPDRAAGMAPDLSALAEDLLMSGAYDDAVMVTRTLRTRASTPQSIGREASRYALDQLGESLAMRESVALIGDVDEDNWNAMKAVIDTVGASSVEALKSVVAVENDDLTTDRAEGVIVGFGDKAVLRLASLVTDKRWFVQRRGARLLGRIGKADAVPLLQPLLRQNDPRVAREAVAALGVIQDPAAARAIHTVLRAATGEVRGAVIEALAAARSARRPDARPHPRESSRSAGSRGRARDDRGAGHGRHRGSVPFSPPAQRKRFLGGRKLRALKDRSVEALARVKTDKAMAALKDAAEHGDRYLKKIARAKL